MNKATCQSILSDRLNAMEKEFRALKMISETILANVVDYKEISSRKELTLKEIEVVTSYITETCQDSIKVAEKHKKRMTHLPLRLERALYDLQRIKKIKG